MISLVLSGSSREFGWLGKLATLPTLTFSCSKALQIGLIYSRIAGDAIGAVAAVAMAWVIRAQRLRESLYRGAGASFAKHGRAVRRWSFMPRSCGEIDAGHRRVLPDAVFNLSHGLEFRPSTSRLLLRCTTSTVW